MNKILMLANQLVLSRLYVYQNEAESNKEIRLALNRPIVISHYLLLWTTHKNGGSVVNCLEKNKRSAQLVFGVKNRTIRNQKLNFKNTSL